MARARWILLVLSFSCPSIVAAQADVTADIPLLQRADSVRIFLSETAEVVIEEFIDFACSDCRQFHSQMGDSLRALVEDEDVTFILRVYPIPRLMRGYHASEAAFCAGALAGRSAFLAMVDRLFTYQTSWKPQVDPTPFFEAYAEDIGVPLAAFSNCLERDAMAPLIISDVRLASDYGVPGTPTFVFNKKEEFSGEEKFYGIQPMSRFMESIEDVRQRQE
jgi:protein-disulfide isomerase